MLETYRFVAMLATKQPPYQLVPEDPSPGKVVTNIKLRIYITSTIIRMCIDIHPHPQTPTDFTDL